MKPERAIRKCACNSFALVQARASVYKCKKAEKAATWASQVTISMFILKFILKKNQKSSKSVKSVKCLVTRSWNLSDVNIMMSL